MRRGIAAAAFGVCALVALHASAHADVIWNFTYDATLDVPFNPIYPTNPGGAITASGQLTTTDLGGNVYSITGITGTYDGLTISLIPAGGYAGNDNLLFTAGSSYLDGLGLSFIAGGQPVNLYNGGGGKYDDATEDNEYEISDNGVFSISLAQIAVPEPSSIALFGAALVGFAVTRRRRRT